MGVCDHSRHKTKLGDVVAALMLAMRSIEMFVIPVLLANRVAASYPGFSGNPSLERHPCREDNDTDNGTSRRDALLNTIQSEASRWAMVYWMMTSLPGAILTVLLGSWSDRLGRRMLMMIASVGFALEAAITMAVIYWKLHIAVLVTGASLEGVMGGYPTVLLACYSYAADRSDQGRRTGRLVFTELASVLGMALGNLVGGIVMKHFGVLATQSIVLVGHCVNIIYIGAFLEESTDITHILNRDSCQPKGVNHLPVNTERTPLLTEQTMKDPLQVGASQSSPWQPEALAQFQAPPSQHGAYSKSLIMKRTFTLVFTQSPMRARLLAILLCFALLVLNYSGAKDITVLFVMHKPLCWSSDFFGYFLAARDGGILIALFFFAYLVRHFQPQDQRVVQMTVIAMAAYFATLAFARHDYVMYIGGFFSIFGGPGTATLRAMATKLVDKTDHGAVLSGLAFLETVIVVVATLFYNNLYSVFVKRNIPFLPNSGGICFLIIAAINLVSFLILQCLPKNKPSPSWS